MSSRKVAVVGLSLVMVLALLVSCGTTAAPEATAQPEAPTTQVAQVAEQPTPSTPATETLPDLVVGDVFFFGQGFGPPDTASFWEGRVVSQLYEGLTAFDPAAIARGEAAVPVPGLAESWEISDDGLVYTFKLRPDLKFSTGRPVDAAAVKAAVERAVAVMRAQEVISRYAYAESLTAVETVDDLTVRIKLSEKSGAFLAALTSKQMAIVDVEEAMAHETDGDLGHAWLSVNSAGTNAFMIEEYTAEQKLVLRRNPHYWGGIDGVQPSVERVIFVHVPESSARELQINQGELDIALQLDASSRATLQANPDVAIHLLANPITCSFLVDLRTEPVPNGYPALVQALKYAMDYDGLFQVVAGGVGQIHQTLYPPAMIGFEPNTATLYKHDTDKARQLLTEAGYPDGFSITLHSRTGACGSAVYAKALEFLQQNLAEVGIKVDIAQTTSAAFWGEIYDETFRGIGASGLGPTFLDPDSYTQAHIVDEGNQLGWDNVDPETFARVQELTAAGRSELDSAKRQQIYAEISRLSVEQGPFLTFLAPQDMVVSRANVTGVIASPGANPMEFKYVVKK